MTRKALYRIHVIADYLASVPGWLIILAGTIWLVRMIVISATLLGGGFPDYSGFMPALSLDVGESTLTMRRQCSSTN
ncbi:hypothetical protein P4S72_24785 [Vibrio sp. PP-XX7]